MTLPYHYAPHWGSPIGIALTSALVIICLYILDTLISVPYPKGVPLLREPPGARRFSLKTRLAYYSDCASLFQEAYENVSIVPCDFTTTMGMAAVDRLQYSKKGKAVVIPGLGARVEIILPISSMRWTNSQPTSVLSVGEAFVEMDGAYYAFGTAMPIADDWQGGLVKTEMSKVLENLCEAMNQELGVAFDECFGTDTESWRRIDLLAVVRRVVAQASSRFTVGLPLCRNTEYLNTNLAIIDALVVNAGVSSGSPTLLRPVLGSMSGLPCRLMCRKLSKFLTPLLQERIQIMQSGGAEPQDQIQMMVQFAEKHRPDELFNFDLLTKRLVGTNFGSMHQTSIQVTNMLLNILGSDAEFNTIAVLRSEVAQIHGSSGDGDGGEKQQGWTKAKVAQMVQADSVARETLRLNSFAGRAMFRKVVAPEGAVTDAGVALPRGSVISFLSQPAHLDEANYEDPEKYDPFRFSRVRAEVAGEEKASAKFVTVSTDYMPFSYGRHACPGRFLIDFELKMIIAYILVNYDIKFPDEYGGKRPENYFLTEAYFPPAGAAIMVKRKRTD